MQFTDKNVHEFLLSTRGSWHKPNILGKIFNVSTAEMVQALGRLTQLQGLVNVFRGGRGLACGYPLETNEYNIHAYLLKSPGKGFTVRQLVAVFCSPEEDVEIVLQELMKSAKIVCSVDPRVAPKYSVHTGSLPGLTTPRTFKKEGTYTGFPSYIREKITSRGYKSVPHNSDIPHWFQGAN